MGAAGLAPPSGHHNHERVAPGRRDWVLLAVSLAVLLGAPRAGTAVEPVGSLLVQLSAVGLTVLGQSLPLIRRRAHPVAATVVVLGCYAGYALLMGLVPPLPGWVMLWTLSVALPGRVRAVRATAAAGLVLCVTLVAANLAHPGAGGLTVLVPATIIIGLAGLVVRSERDRLEAAGKYAAVQERLRIAADVHDLVGHGLSAIAVQSSTARIALDANDLVAARAAMVATESTSRTAMREVRHWLEVLRDSEGTAPLPGLDGLAELVGTAGNAGLAVTADLAAAPLQLPPAVQLCAYRIVQEALTNAVKHAPGAVVAVSTAVTEGALVVTVSSSGGVPRSAAPLDSGGHGIAGLRTRVAAIGGQLVAEPARNGWIVRAVLPIAAEPNRRPDDLLGASTLARRESP